MYLTLFAIIGYHLGMGEIYWIILGFSAFVKVLEIVFLKKERREGE